MPKQRDEKPKWLQMRLTDEDEALLDELTSAYSLDRSNLIRKALEHIRETKPIFQIIPQGKTSAPALYVN